MIEVFSDDAISTIKRAHDFLGTFRLQAGQPPTDSETMQEMKSMSPQEIILKHLALAREIHPEFPRTVTRQVLLIMEEAGELVKAVNDAIYKADIESGKARQAAIVNEAAHVAVTAIRTALLADERKTQADVFADAERRRSFYISRKAFAARIFRAVARIGDGIDDYQDCIRVVSMVMDMIAAEEEE